MNLPSLILLSLVVILALWAILHVVRNRRKGRCAGCQCDCPLKQVK